MTKPVSISSDKTETMETIMNDPKMQIKTTLESNYYVTYKLNGISYVPHYSKHCYVGPNYSAFADMTDKKGNKYYVTSKTREYSALQLEKAGASKVIELLWIRPQFKPV